MTNPESIMIGDVKYVPESEVTKPKELDGMSYAIIRSRDQGVMCGYVESVEGRTVTLRQARQIWRYDSTFVLADIAERGMRDPNKAKMSVSMSQPMIMLEACGVMTCTAKAAEQLININAVVK